MAISSDLALPEGLQGLKELGARLGAGRGDSGQSEKGDSEKIASVIAWTGSSDVWTWSRRRERTISAWCLCPMKMNANSRWS